METGQLDFSKDIYLYSQTTKSLDEFHRIIEYCQEHIVEGAVFKSFDELKEKGMPADFDAILKNVEERDYIDTHRETSPLRKADDAITLDNSNMTIPEQKAWLMEQYQKAIAE